MSETSADNKLIQQYLQGDSKSLDVLIEKYLKIIYGFVYKNVGGNPSGQAVAEDITQEVFVKVWKNIKKFNQGKAFKPWLFQIAKNTAIDYLRKKKSIPFSSFENEKGQNPLVDNISASPAKTLENLSDKKSIATVMQNLNAGEQKLISLRHIDGMSFREIAGILNEPVNTVKSRYRRIVMVLRKTQINY